MSKLQWWRWNALCCCHEYLPSHWATPFWHNWLELKIRTPYAFVCQLYQTYNIATWVNFDMFDLMRMTKQTLQWHLYRNIMLTRFIRQIPAEEKYKQPPLNLMVADLRYDFIEKRSFQRNRSKHACLFDWHRICGVWQTSVSARNWLISALTVPRYEQTCSFINVSMEKYRSHLTLYFSFRYIDTVLFITTPECVIYSHIIYTPAH